MATKGGLAGRWQEVPPCCGVSVGAGSEGGVQALRAQAGGEGAPGGGAVLPGLLQRVRGGAGQAGRTQAQEVGEHQVLFAQQSSLVVGSCALRSAQQLKEFCKKNTSNEDCELSKVP